MTKVLEKGLNGKSIIHSTYRICILLFLFIIGSQVRMFALSLQSQTDCTDQFLGKKDIGGMANKMLSPMHDTIFPSKDKDKDIKKKKEEEKDSNSDDVLNFADVMPKFPNGDAALVSFIARSIRYPQEALEQGKSGRVVCMFVVNEDGSISDIEIIRGVSDALNKEAIRVIKAMPRWEPGMQDGKKVKVKYSIPITFRLN